MLLYYDRMANIVTLRTEDKTVFLGPLTHAIVSLQFDYGLTTSQAREAILCAVFNQGAEVDLDFVKRIASASEFFTEIERV